MREKGREKEKGGKKGGRENTKLFSKSLRS